MKTKFFTFFFAIMAISSLWAYDFKYGDLYYNITNDTIPYTVAVTYQYYESSSNYSGLVDIVIPQEVCYNNRIYSVTSIGSGAFEACGTLKSITIPNSVKIIRGYAFERCSRLESVNIPNTVTQIGEGAFIRCGVLGSIIIPYSVKTIETSTFSYCSSLTSVVLGDSVQVIKNEAFYHCGKLTSIEIPDNVKKIGNAIFRYCKSLHSVSLGDSIQEIGDHAFSDCYSLEEMTCKSLIIPKTERMFYNTDIKQSTLYVYDCVLEQYKSLYPWNKFGAILPIDGQTTSIKDFHLLSTNKCCVQKIFKNGTIYIIRDKKMYDILGNEL